MAWSVVTTSVFDATNSNLGTAGTSTPTSVSSSLTAGNKLAMIVELIGVTLSSVTDDKSETYRVTAVNTGQGWNTYIVDSDLASSGVHTLTFHLSGTPSGRSGVDGSEISGVATGAPSILGTGSNFSGTPASITTTGSPSTGAFVFGGCFVDGTVTAISDSALSLFTNGGWDLKTQYKTGAAAAATMTWSFASNHSWNGYIAAWNAAAVSTFLPKILTYG